MRYQPQFPKLLVYTGNHGKESNHHAAYALSIQRAVFISRLGFRKSRRKSVPSDVGTARDHSGSQRAPTEVPDDEEDHG